MTKLTKGYNKDTIGPTAKRYSNGVSLTADHGLKLYAGWVCTPSGDDIRMVFRVHTDLKSTLI